MIRISKLLFNIIFSCVLFNAISGMTVSELSDHYSEVLLDDIGKNDFNSFAKDLFEFENKLIALEGSEAKSCFGPVIFQLAERISKPWMAKDLRFLYLLLAEKGLKFVPYFQYLRLREYSYITSLPGHAVYEAYQKEFMEAIEHNDLEKVKQMLSNFYDTMKYSLIYLAIDIKNRTR